jgi:ActR/RegA family two-component response regulator
VVLTGAPGRASMPPIRILFVDDEPNIRLTLPQILQRHGYNVRSAATVAQALAEINSSTFDVLIADLNIGQVGDGFTVVSAMRRTQPECVNFILTGYPAFETALQAIRSQVDDYLVKPAEIENLISSIEMKLQNRRPYQAMPLKRVGIILRENADDITGKVLKKMKSLPELGELQLSDDERVNYLPGFLKEIAHQLELPPAEKSSFPAAFANEHGKLRYGQGYSLPAMVEDARLLHDAVYEVVQENLLVLDLSRLIFDLRRMDDCIDVGLKEALNAYIAAGKQLAGASGEKKKGKSARISKPAARKKVAG